MSSNGSIQAVGGVGKRDKKARESMGASAAAKPQFQASAVQQGAQTARQGDSVQLSEEVKEASGAGSSNVNAIKGGIANIKNQLAVKPSGEDASAGLVNGSMSVQMERNGLQGATPPQQNLGVTPGLHNGGTMGVKGIQNGMEPGMKAGGVHSSRRAPSVGHQSGGGTATPKMVKLQTDFAKALKAGHGINPQANNMVANTFASSGKSVKPLNAMLGTKKSVVA